jgi:hypothetical protein
VKIDDGNLLGEGGAFVVAQENNEEVSNNNERYKNFISV